jgi:class 3 adenylate cyclase
LWRLWSARILGRMLRARASRRVATVLFVDIVDSTRIAAEVGDHRWRDLLGAFRRGVRQELKLHGGHEQDTAGDGFFATFSQPAEAIRAAAGIVRRANLIGLEVRCGLHAGELERIDGHLGGIAAHIGARIMAQAAAGEVLVTATVHDLAVGSMVAFEEMGDTTLKGVPGAWRMYRVSAVDREPLVEATSAAEAVERRSATEGSPRARGAYVALGAIAMLLVLVMAGALLVQPPRAGLAPSPSTSLPVTMLRIDAMSGEITTQVRDRYLALGYSAPLWEVDGNLWQITAVEAVRRDILTGAVAATVDLPNNTVTAFGVTFAFGSIWVHRELDAASELVRIDPLNGRVLAEVSMPQRIRFAEIHAGPDAMWVLSQAGSLMEVDPLTNELIGEYPVGTETPPDGFTVLGNTAWVCECAHGRVTTFDLQTHELAPAREFAQRGFVVPDSAEGSQAGPSSANGEVWLLDSGAGTVTPVDATTGTAGRPIAITRPIWDVEFGAGALWVAGWTAVHRVDLEHGDIVSIEMPSDFRAAAIGVDEATNSVWVSSCMHNGEECD